MAKRGFTLLIIPRADGPVRTFGVPRSFLVRLLSVLAVAVLLSLYLVYDYISVRRDAAELARLRTVTADQEKQIAGLAGRLERFGARIDELGALDRKIRIAANIESSRDKQEILGIGGAVPDERRISTRLEGDRQAVLREIAQGVDQLDQEAVRQEKSFVQILQFLNRQRSIVATTPSIWPVTGWVTSEFGRRTNPFGGRSEFHTAIDIATKLGAPIKAPANGIVSNVEKRPDVGLMIQIEHGRGIGTLYAHLFRAAVSKGQVVKRGDVIGYVGNSGRSTGAHLHYSVSLNGVYVNPRNYLR